MAAPRKKQWFPVWGSLAHLANAASSGFGSVDVGNTRKAVCPASTSGVWICMRNREHSWCNMSKDAASVRWYARRHRCMAGRTPRVHQKSVPAMALLKLQRRLWGWDGAGTCQSAQYSPAPAACHLQQQHLATAFAPLVATHPGPPEPNAFLPRGGSWGSDPSLNPHPRASWHKGGMVRKTGGTEERNPHPEAGKRVALDQSNESGGHKRGKGNCGMSRCARSDCAQSRALWTARSRGPCASPATRRGRSCGPPCTAEASVSPTRTAACACGTSGLPQARGLPQRHGCRWSAMCWPVRGALGGAHTQTVRHKCEYRRILPTKYCLWLQCANKPG